MRPDEQKLTAIDLFSGAGGLTCGLKQAGFQVLAGVELDEVAAHTYQHNHRDSLILQNDIRDLSPTSVMQQLNLKPGELDLLAGCPPCQGFSSLRTKNKQLSTDDERNDLVFEFIKWVDAFRPKTLMMENVPTLAKDQRMTQFIKSVSQLGYKVTQDSLRVEDIAIYGVPQRRRRMVFLASLYEGLKTAEPVTVKTTVYDAIGGLKKAGSSGDLLHDWPEVRSPRVMEMIKLIPKNGGSRSDLPKEYWLECHKRYPKGFTDVYGRMSWDTVAPTITGGCANPSKGRYLHPYEDRAITLREASLLQTFPADYYFPVTFGKDKVALMIGNALPPKFIRQQGKAIKQHLLSSGEQL